jgi:hypothetical protein
MKPKFSEEKFFQAVVVWGGATVLIALALYAYLGIFSRYTSDDYCLSAFFKQDDLFSAMIKRYFTSSSRYTNILFIGLVDKIFGWYNVAILPALMLILFVLGLYLLLKEIRDMLQLSWSRLTIFFLSGFAVYFSVSQAPDLYQTLYWRAGMTSHFVPLVLIPFFAAFLLRQIRKTKERFPSVWVQAACFLIPFLIGGLSEPPTALIITILGLAIVAAWCWGDSRYRRAILLILFWSLAGAMVALIVMALAPANGLRMRTAAPSLLELIFRIFYYPSYFLIDTLQTLPTPTLISVAVPALLFYVKYTQPSKYTSKEQRNRLRILIFLVLLLAYLFIAASFAPSAYGQSYPVPRARFIGRLLFTSALMTEGGLLGVLVAQARTTLVQATYLRSVAALALLLLAFYPLRTAQRLFQDVPVYQERAIAWDAREVQIYRLKAAGEKDLIVPFLSTDPIQDLGDHTGFRLNRCAATLYGVNSIVAMPIKK